MRISKIAALLFALNLAGTGHVLANESAAQEPRDETPLPSPAVQIDAASAKDSQPAGLVLEKDKGEPNSPKGKSENRFREIVGAGKSEAVRIVPSVSGKPPKPAVGKNALDSAQQSIDKALQAGGEAMDPSLREINLPGLKKDDPSLKPWVLHTRGGVNEVVKLSASLINRIATPFNKPVIIDSTESITKIIGSDVYYTPTGTQPIGVFIVDSENRGQTISLTIIPVKNIPGQNLIIKMEDLRVAEDLAPGNPKNIKKIPSQENDFHGFVRSVMSNAIRGNIPGYSIVPLERGVAMIGHIQVVPDLVFSGQTNDVYRYKLINTHESQADLYEPAFYREGVKAVSYFPRLSLKKNESTYVFILADKPAVGASQ